MYLEREGHHSPALYEKRRVGYGHGGRHDEDPQWGHNFTSFWFACTNNEYVKDEPRDMAIVQ